jgi:hypothetical protein
MYEKFEESKDESAFELDFSVIKPKNIKARDLQEYESQSEDE